MWNTEKCQPDPAAQEAGGKWECLSWVLFPCGVKSREAHVSVVSSQDGRQQLSVRC